MSYKKSENIETENENLEETELKQSDSLQEKITKAKIEITSAIIQTERLHELPSYITELIVSSCLADVRECTNKELLIEIKQNS